MHGADVDECTNNAREYPMNTQDNNLRAEFCLGDNLEEKVEAKQIDISCSKLAGQITVIFGLTGKFCLVCIVLRFIISVYMLNSAIAK